MEIDVDIMPDAEAPDEKPVSEALVIDDETLLQICAAEQTAAVNYETDEELSDQRERALEYTKGVMKDVPSMPKRSKAVSTDVADFIEAELPDILDILVGGEDPVTFKPTGPEDVEQAELETKYVRHVVFEQNDGWMVTYTGIKDMAEVKTGIAKFWWQDGEEIEEEFYEGQTAVAMQLAEQAGYELDDVEEVPDEQFGAVYNYTARRTKNAGQVKIMSVDPADFSVSADATLANFDEVPYCRHRSRVRAQDLIQQGFDAEKVKSLPAYSDYDDEEERARDTVDESDDGRHPDSHETLRTVEVYEHWLRVDADGDGKPEIWKIVTDPSSSILLSKEKKNRIGFAVGTMYPRTHRFYGLSEADKLMEVQRIKTSLLRSNLDGYYFGLNKRYEVSEADQNANTITDLLRNEPGVPIRSRTGNAIRPINDNGSTTTTYEGLEYITTMGEERTGINRSTQGLNPDTLHDTASGALALMSNSAKRVRLKARIIAATFMRRLCLGVQAELAERMTEPDRVRFHGDKEFTQVDPTKFGRRKDMEVVVAVGSGEKEQMLGAITQVLEQQAIVVDRQGGMDGPLLTPAHIHRTLTAFVEIAGMRDPSRYWADPEEQQQQQGEEGPSPEEQAMQAELQMKQAEMQMKSQMDQAKLQMDQQKAQAQIQIEQQKAQAAQALEQLKAGQAHELAQQKAELEANLAIQKMQFEADMAERKLQFDSSLAAQKHSEDKLPGYRPGGDLSK